MFEISDRSVLGTPSEKRDGKEEALQLGLISVKAESSLRSGSRTQSDSEIEKKDGRVAVRIDAKTERMLEDLERAHFNYFVKNSDPVTGYTKDRSTPDSASSIAATGFSLSAHLAAADRGWITREQAADYTIKVLRTLWNSPQSDAEQGAAGYKGFYYHFLDQRTGLRTWNCELSTIDTALLMAGVLSSQSYFDKDSDKENEIRDLARKLYDRVDWNWAMNGKDTMSMGWEPKSKQMFNASWQGYNEAMILLTLGLGSSTHPIPAKAWQDWAKTYSTFTNNRGEKYISFSPLFGHQYSHSWIDYRGIKDADNQKIGADYFENSRRATYAQHEYAKQNPYGFRAYSSLDWGLTASDGPGHAQKTYNGKTYFFEGYSAHGAPNGFDDGTISPTAAASSLPYAPELVLPTLKHWLNKRPELMSREGFADAFNPTFDPKKNSGWVDRDRLGIDQGPIVMAIENYRTGLFWDLMKRNEAIKTGLKRAGFTGGWLDKTKP